MISRAGRAGAAATLLGLGVFFLFGAEARASRSATVIADVTPLLEGPAKDATVLEKLVKDDLLSVSNFASKGYYKARTGAGSVGWVAEEALEIGPMPEGAEQERAFEAAREAAAPLAPEHPARRKLRLGAETIRFRAFGGMNFFQAREVNEFLSLGSLANGFGYGGELHLTFSPELALVVRAERMIKSVVAQDEASTQVFDIGVSSVPVMLGLEWTLARERGYAFYLGGLAGVGVNTTLSSTLVQTPANPIDSTRFVSNGLAGLVRGVLAYQATAAVQLYAEAGYRFLATTTGAPVGEGTGKEMWQDGGEYRPLRVDQGGFTGAVGFALHL